MVMVASDMASDERFFVISYLWYSWVLGLVVLC